MSLTLGIVGLPNVGKSTLFNALTRSQVLVANYAFATIEPNVGVVPLPDARLPVLAKMFGSAKVVPATVSFVDIAGLVAGASQGAGLGNRFLAHIREANAICQVVRAFHDPDVLHVAGELDPAGDIATLETELVLADLQTLDRVLARLEKQAQTHPRQGSAVLVAARAARAVLDSGRTLFDARAELDIAALAEFNLLTTKPFLYVFNCDEAVLTDPQRQAALRKLVEGADAVFLDAKVESELLDLDPASARELLDSIGQPEPGLHTLARAAFHTLGLHTFLTAGPKEARAWTIRNGTTAFEAAGVIHSDFQRGFIKAEVVSYDDLVAAGSVARARAAGKVRMEGKDYVLAEGDVVTFRFSR